MTVETPLERFSERVAERTPAGDRAVPRPAEEFTPAGDTSAPPLALAGADDDLPDPHIVRGID